MNDDLQLTPGDIVQINPNVERFGGSLMVVTELKSWGVQGYVQVPGSGQAYYRCKFEDMERTWGRAVWLAD